MEQAAAALTAVMGAAHALAAPASQAATSQPAGGSMAIGAARRPNLGSLGTAVSLLTNYFALSCLPNFPQRAYQYEVAIRPARSPPTHGDSGVQGRGPGLGRGSGSTAGVPAALVYGIVEALARQQGWSHGTARCDGRSVMYLPAELLPAELHDWNVKLAVTPGGNNERDFVVSTRLLSEIPLSGLQDYLAGRLARVPRDTMQVVDMVIRSAFAVHPAVVIVGQTFLYADAATRLGRGNEIWGGFRQSVKAVQSGLLLNMDTAFYPVVSERPLVELMAELCSSRGAEGLARAGPAGWACAAKGVAGLKVEFAQAKGNRRKALSGMTEQGADRTMFMNDKEGRLMSVAEYFANTGRPLAWPQLPCANLGSKAKPNFVPVELCTVVGGQVRGRTPDSATANAIGNASKQEPGPRKGFIGKQATRAQQTLQDSGADSAWGLAMGTSLLQTPGRVLPAPTLQYGGERNLAPGGSGMWTVRDVKFLDAQAVSSWAVAVLMPREDVDTTDSRTSLWAFLQLLASSMEKAGMRLVDPVNPRAGTGPPVEWGLQGRQQRSIEATMCAAAEAARAKYGRPAQLLLVVLPAKTTEEYRQVKRVSDVLLGLPSQVVTGKTARIGRQNNQDRAGGPVYCANLALKINSKLGGVNVSLSHGPRFLPVLGGARAPPFMLLGADVTHPTGPSCKPGVKEPSVAAVVASIDQTLGRWASRVLLQPYRQELITGMRGAAKDLLLEFYRQNRGAKPQRLVMYRDGVGEAQFEQALAEEFVALRMACTDLQEDYRPAITFVIVQKRHNTRLLPADHAAADRKGNVVPGTVVDRGITTPDNFDFYLNSHAGVLGTNKPAHYHVLVDEIGFGADGMQLLTYWLCYLYQRTTKSVSYCPPAYYADRAAYRGRQLLIAAASASGNARSADGAEAWFEGVHRNLNNVLYFM